MGWHEETLNPSNREGLGRLAETPFLALGDVCLVGGTAIALQLGHRVSDDLDFVYSDIPSLAGAEDMVREALGGDLIPLDAVSFATHYRHDSKFSLIRLGAKMLQPPSTENPYGVRVASLLDLMLMKLLAVYQRGTERDFVDVYFMGRLASLDPSSCVGRLGEKYGSADISHNVALSLKYFEDAEGDQERAIEPLIPYRWEDVKAYCRDEADRIISDYR